MASKATGPGVGPGQADSVPLAVARQRWRLVLARPADGPEHPSRDAADAWDEALESSGLPLYRPTGRRRALVAYGAPLPARVAAERDLADLVLTASLPAWQVRAAVTDSLPAGWRLIDLYDVWLGAPSLAGQVVAADYRIDLGPVSGEAIAAAADALLAAERLPRERQKGGSLVRYDLRPLLGGVRVVDVGPPVLVRVRTRFHPELGTGRPAEVVAALGDVVGTALEGGAVVRERLILAGDPEPDGDHGSGAPR